METQQPPPVEKPKHWKIYFDGSLNLEGVGSGVLFISPQGDHLKYVLQIYYKASNNGAAYEALIHGLRIDVSLGIKRLIAYGDSKVVIDQVNKACDIKKETMNAYCAEVRKLKDHFEALEFHHVSRDNNMAADVRSKLGSKRALATASLFVQDLHKPSIRLLSDPETSPSDIPGSRVFSWQRPKMTSAPTSSPTSWRSASQKTRSSATRSSTALPITSSSAPSCIGGPPPTVC
jgi:ribonuclease HI